MTDSYQNKRALLVGNGVNLLDSSQSFSWGALFQELKNNYGIDVDLDNVFKPFPLAFDEMLHHKPGSNDFNDKLKTLKQRISRSFKDNLKVKGDLINIMKRLHHYPTMIFLQLTMITLYRKA